MNEDLALIQSPLSCTITDSGHRIEVHIYRLADTPWTLEVMNRSGTSICWDAPFETDQDAMAEVERRIAEEGIETLAVDEPSAPPSQD